jgi:hypothetical protein
MQSFAIRDVGGDLEMMVLHFRKTLRGDVEFTPAGVFGKLEQPVCRFAKCGHHDHGALREMRAHRSN